LDLGPWRPERDPPYFFNRPLDAGVERGVGRAPGADAGEKNAWVFLSAGERSADQHAARVARELTARRPDLGLVGLGGPAMAAAGVELLAGLEELAVMGFAEVARRLPFFLSLRRRVWRTLLTRDVRLVLPVDYPGFNLPLARRAHGLGVPVLYYIAPQVWAWREGRARRLAETCDRVLTVLPFERERLVMHGVDARFVGHPLLDEDAPAPRNRIPGANGGGSPVLGLFPGSRAQEVERMLPAFGEAARRLADRHPGLEVLVARPPHLPGALYEPCAFETVDAPEAVGRATVALTKSGTITLELALAGVPMVVGYRTSPLTYALARRVVRVPSIALVNLVAGERVVPELVQDELSPDALVRAARPLVDPDAPEAIDQREALVRVRGLLGEPGCARRVASHALELLGVPG